MQLAISLFGFGLGLLFRGLFYNQPLGISALIFTIFLVAVVALTARLGQRRLPAQTAWPVLGLLFFSSMIFVRASFSLTFWNIIICLLLITFFVAAGRRTPLVHPALLHYFRLVFQPFIWLVQGLIFLIEAFGSGVRSDKNRLGRRIVAGVFLALPFLFLFAILFGAADPIFADYLLKIFHFELSIDVVSQVVIVGLITLLATGALRMLLQKDELPALAETNRLVSPKVGLVETITVLSLVDLLFALFIIVQFAYLFNGSGNVGPTGLSYSEYARRGVGELTWAALLAFFLEAAVMMVSGQIEKQRERRAFQWVTSLLAVGVLIVVFSANYRLGLYEDAYGFTTTRLYGHAFIWWLGAVFLLVLARIYLPKVSARFVPLVGLSAIFAFALLNLANPDAMIARANITKFSVSEKQDISYLAYELSEDAVPVVVPLLDQGSDDFRRSLARMLTFRFEALETAHNRDPWTSFHWGREQARRVLNERQEFLMQNKNYVSEKERGQSYVCVVADQANTYQPISPTDGGHSIDETCGDGMILRSGVPAITPTVQP